MDIQKAIDSIVEAVSEVVEAIIELIKDISKAVSDAFRLWLVHEPKRKTTVGASIAKFKSWVRKIFQRRIRRKYTQCMKGGVYYEKGNS